MIATFPFARVLCPPKFTLHSNQPKIRSLANTFDSMIFSQISYQLTEKGRKRSNKELTRTKAIHFGEFFEQGFIMMLPNDYVDWLAKVREDGGEFAWIRGRPSADVNKDRKTREQLVKRILESLNVKASVLKFLVFCCNFSNAFLGVKKSHIQAELLSFIFTCEQFKLTPNFIQILIYRMP
jgi:hypothetical protein